MGTAYTPGLSVSPRTTIEKLRRLPLKGTVLVREGEVVTPNTVVARTELPGLMQTIKVAERMGIEASEVAGVLRIKVGDTIKKDDVIAETKGLFGKFFRSEFKSPVSGKVELISPTTGHVGVREAPTPVEKDAYIRGTIAKVIPEEGVIVRCEGALVQGIFGVGGERLGEIVVVTDGPDKPITDATLTPAHAGKIVVGGSNVSGAALRKAAQLGVIGIVCGGVVDRELMDYLAEALNQPGYDIGVAITGQEPIAFTLIITEGFGTIDMAEAHLRALPVAPGQDRLDQRRDPDPRRRHPPRSHRPPLRRPHRHRQRRQRRRERPTRHRHPDPRHPRTLLRHPRLRHRPPGKAPESRIRNHGPRPGSQTRRRPHRHRPPRQRRNHRRTVDIRIHCIEVWGYRDCRILWPFLTGSPFGREFLSRSRS